MYHSEKCRSSEHYQKMVAARVENFKKTFESRFWSRVNKNGPTPEHCPHLGRCWEWTAAFKNKGYGKMQHNGKLEAAHRISWEFYHGRIPDGKWILHKCDNPKCVRETHLYEGTQQDNTRDAVERKRLCSGKDNMFSNLIGEQNYNAVLNVEIVRGIRAKYVPKRFGYKRVSNFFGVPLSTVASVILRRTWKHV